MLAIRNKLKRLFHSYPKLSFVSQHFVFTLAPLRWSFSQYCIRYFPAISFVIFPLCVHYFSPTLCLSFSHRCILIFPPSVCHFSAIVFVFFLPFCLSFSRHCVRQSSLSRCSRHYICHLVRHLPACTLIIFSLGCHYVCHFPAITFFTSRPRVCPEL